MLADLGFGQTGSFTGPAELTGRASSWAGTIGFGGWVEAEKWARWLVCAYAGFLLEYD